MPDSIVSSRETTSEIDQLRQRVLELEVFQSALVSGLELFSSGPVVVFRWLLVPRWTVQFVTPNINDLLGYAPEDFISERVKYADLIYPPDAEQSNRQIQQAISQRHERVTQHYRIRRADGTVRWLEDCTQIRYTPSGEAQYLDGYVFDITERKMAEDALRASEEHYRAIFNASPDLIYVTDLTGRLLSANAALLAKVGLTLAELHTLSIADHYAGTDRTLIPALLQRVAAGEELNDLQIPMYNLHGQLEYYEVHARLVRLPGGGGVILTVARDITERRRMDEVLRRSEEEYRSLYAAEQRHALELALLDRVRAALIREIDLPIIIRTVVEAIASTFGYTQVSLYLLRGEVLLLQHQVGYATVIPQIPINTGVTGRVARTGQAVLLRDVSNVPEFLAAIDGVLSEVCTPLTDLGKVVGVLNVESTGGVMLTEVDLRLMTTLSEYVSLAIGHARLYAQAQQELSERKQAEETLKRYGQQMAALYATSLEINSQPDVAALLQTIVQRAADLIGVHAGGLYLLNPDGQALRLAVTYNQPGSDFNVRLQLGEGLSGRVAQSGLPMMVADYATWDGRPAAYANSIFHRALGVPLKVGQRVIGVINVTDDGSTEPFTDDEMQLVGLFADQAAIAIENARLLEAEQRQARIQAALLAASTAISSTLDLGAVLNQIAEHMAQAIDVTSVSICDWQPASGLATVLAEYIAPGAPPEEQDAGSDLGAAYDLIGDFGDDLDQWLLIGKPIVTQVDDPDLYEPARRHLQQYGGRSALTVPLVFQGSSVGYVDLWESRRRREFTDEEIALCQSIAHQAAIAMEHARLFQAVRRHAADLEQRVRERTSELLEANVRLTELDRLKDEFISRISHELRTPLTSIGIYLDLLETGKPEKRPKYMQTLSAQVSRLQALIDDLLSVSQAETDLDTMTLATVNVNALIAQVVERQQAVAAQRDLQLGLKLDDSLPAILSDEAVLARILTNLLSNALNYTRPPGRITVRTDLSAAAGRWVTIAVADTGPGISDRDLPHLFEPFYRGEAARDYKTPGTGVGLTVAQRSAVTLGGRITVESLTGQGATFTLWLPLHV